MVDDRVLLMLCDAGNKPIIGGGTYENLMGRRIVPTTLHTPGVRLQRRGAVRLPAGTS